MIAIQKAYLDKKKKLKKVTTRSLYIFEISLCVSIRYAKRHSRGLVPIFG